MAQHPSLISHSSLVGRSLVFKLKIKQNELRGKSESDSVQHKIFSGIFLILNVLSLSLFLAWLKSILYHKLQLKPKSWLVHHWAEQLELILFVSFQLNFAPFPSPATWKTSSSDWICFLSTHEPCLVLILLWGGMKGFILMIPLWWSHLCGCHYQEDRSWSRHRFSAESL